MGQLLNETRRSLFDRFSELGLAPMQGFALRNLDPETPMAMSALASALHCDNSNVTGLVDGLEAHGLVERRPAEYDRRVRMVVVTERGAQVRERMHEVVQAGPPALAALSPDDQRALRDILRRALG